MRGSGSGRAGCAISLCALLLACGGKTSGLNDVPGASGAPHTAGTYGVPADYSGAGGTPSNEAGTSDENDAAGAAGTVDDIQRPGPDGYGYLPDGCILNVIDADADSNIGVMELRAESGSGSVINEAAHERQAFFDTRWISPEPPYVLYLRLSIGGPAPTLGAKYIIDPSGPNANTQVLFQLDESPKQQWEAVPGGVLTVHGAKHEDPLAGTSEAGKYGYTLVSFWLKALELQPSTNADNQARGHFKFSGYCEGTINDHYYAP